MTAEPSFSTLNPARQAQIVAELMDLFRSNERGYGVGEYEGAHFNEDKGKWIPGHVRWTWGSTTEDHWRAHLAGVRLLGQGNLCDDNCVWYACLDIDIYDIDYVVEMQKVTSSGLPLVVFRTKSGGLRVTVFFSESIDGESVVSRMRKVAAQLGYSGCEIFPKQTKLDVDHGDCPSWIYMPLSPGKDGVFSEQGCMNESGNLMELEESINWMKSKRISKTQFLELFTVEETARTNGKTNGKKHPKGKWKEEETYELTLNTMFHDGPVCLWIIAHNKCTHMQNNFLFNTAMFLRKKYEINWEEALTWVNYNVLRPVGEREKLNSLIKRKPDKNYLCDQEPICSHCNSHACRKMDYGVGQNGTSIDVYELGLTALNRLPRIYFANLGNGDEEIRMQMTSNELRKLDRFKVKCMDHGLPIPLVDNQKAWEKIVNKNLESATLVEPSHIMRTNAAELDLLMKFFSSRIKTFLRQGEKEDDQVRVRPEERRIYFKEQRIIEWCRWERLDIDRMVSFIHNSCEHHHQGRGKIRKWWRFTYSISYDVMDEDKLEEWFNEENGDEESGHAV